MFKQPKRHIKIAILMFLLPTEAATEEKMNSHIDQHHLMYHWRPQIVQENLD